jgi:hypothetical protein
LLNFKYIFGIISCVTQEQEIVLDTKCIAVFTARSPQRIVGEGGSQAWALDPNRARTYPYLVCIQNQNNPDRDFSDASEAHGKAFLVGKISDVVPAAEEFTPGRWLIRISEYSALNLHNAWKGWRNPVKYTTLEEMGIDVNELRFHSVAEFQPGLGRAAHDGALARTSDDGLAKGISIAEAKTGLATFYGVHPEAVEIVIRG